MNNNMNEFKTKDKGLVAYLLLCDGVEYSGQDSDGTALYFRFTPLDVAVAKKQQYETSNMPLVQPQQYLVKLRLVSRWISEWRLKTFVKPKVDLYR